MATGTVTWVHAGKGHGFIAPAGGGEDLFVERTEVVGDAKALVVGATVDFEQRAGPRGRILATSVVVRQSPSGRREQRDRSTTR